MERLGLGTDDNVLIDDVARAHGGAVEDAGMRLDDAVVADGDIAFDVGKGMNLYVFPDFGSGIDESKRTNHSCFGVIGFTDGLLRALDRA